MVITKLIGGLGNQMFQYATGKALAIHHQTDVKVDTAFLREDPAGKYTKRHYELLAFNTEINEIEDGERHQFLKKKNTRARNFLSKNFPGIFPGRVFTEKGPYYHQDILNCPKNVYLSGFWQSEKYFQKYRDTITRDFMIKPEFLSGIEDWRERIQSSTSISLHVRRGDYISDPRTNAYHGVCSLSYYQQAVDIVSAKTDSPVIFIFSDDIAWCKQNMKFRHPVQFIETGSQYKDLYLMSICEHNIIANSSFSWWAAWLNKNPVKIVVAPSRWYNDPSTNTIDLIPGNWIKI